LDPLFTVKEVFLFQLSVVFLLSGDCRLQWL
jgi:hypothetical protein